MLVISMGSSNEDFGRHHFLIKKGWIVSRNENILCFFINDLFTLPIVYMFLSVFKIQFNYMFNLNLRRKIEQCL